MAIINNNVQNVKFLRNQDVNITRDAAISLLNTHKEDAADGTALLARYTVSGTVKTIVGFVYVTGSTHDITIFDTEGASGDVEELRKEINAKLGTGITSANTATEQLAALSGTSSDASGVTSVWGAKAYADDLISTLDYEDAAVAGQYVSQVTQADGKIAVTRVDLPSSADTAVAKKFVTAVAEDKGQITVSRGEISSSAETMVLTDNADGGINFEVNIDGASIVQDPTSKKIKVADSALTQYYGDEKTIHAEVDATTNKKTFNTLLQISATTSSEANVRAQYNLVNASGETIGETIKIYKDSALLSVALLHADTAADPQVLPTYDKIDGWTDIPETAQTQANQALCYAYEDVKGDIVVAAVPVGSFINEQEFASGITWDSVVGKVKGVVDTTSEKDSQETPVDFLTVGADGFKVSGIKNEINRKINALDATVTGATSGNHVTISIEEVDGKLVQSGLTIQEDDIASASDLAELSAKTVTEITSSNNSISASSATTTDGTVKYDIVTDADKIQMSGFSSTTASSLSGIAESDSIATAFEKTNEVITDLNTSVDTISGDVNTIEKQYISGVSVNGSTVTVSNHVAPISISAATSATTSTSTEAITVETGQGGAITLGIANIDCGYYDGTQS